MLVTLHTSYDPVQVLRHYLGHLGAKHLKKMSAKLLGIPGPCLHVILDTLHANYDPTVQLLLQCVGTWDYAPWNSAIIYG